MSYHVLARKWRPKKFQDVTGQSHITKSLQGALNQKKLSGAYLFSGTRGVGKTSVARILAQAARCENLLDDLNPCGECLSCVDSINPSSMNVIELDGASNNSVDDIREIVNNVNYLPSVGERKVYIIDEVHMLSQSAFNALLKTLEEPPEHVIFIFATTEPQKVIPTVLSRCQRFDFKTVSTDGLVAHIKTIAKSEEISFESEDIIRKLCEKAEGSVRDSLSLLEQVLCYCENNKVSEETLTLSLGLVKASTLTELSDSIWREDVLQLQKTFQEVLSSNISLKILVKDLLTGIFKDIQENTYPSKLSRAEAYWVYENLSKDLTWAVDSILPDQSIQLVLQKIAQRSEFFVKKKQQIVNSQEVIPKQSVPKIKIEEKEEVKEEILAKPSKPQAPVEVVLTKPKWDDFLAYLKTKAPAAASNLEQGNVLSPIVVETNSVTIELGFSRSSLVFFEYLNNTDVRDNIINHLSEFFKTSKEKIFLNMKQVGKNNNFKSKAELKRIEVDNIMQDKRENIKSNPILLKAESIFNTKIDKVKLK